MKGEKSPLRVPSQGETSLLAGLPLAHRRHLISQFKVPSKVKTVDEQSRFIAERMDAKIIANYVKVYLDGTGGAVAYFRFTGDVASASTFVDALVARRPALLTIEGERRDVVPNAPPLLHRVLRFEGYDVLEYVAKDGVTRSYHDYGRDPRPVEHLYRVVLRQTPFSVEIRAGSAPKQKRLIELVQEDLGCQFGGDLPCLPKGEQGCDALAKILDARFVRVAFRTTGGGAKSVSIDADEQSGIEATDRYKDEIGKGSKEISRGYEFHSYHTEDKYVEAATYDITVTSGQMRISGRASEYAIERLRQQVVTHFVPTPPEGDANAKAP